MLTISEKITRIICDPKGRRKLGGMSRVAEYCGVPHSTVIAWIKGSIPTKEKAAKLATMFSDKTFTITKKKSGVVKGERKWRFNAKREHVYEKL